MVAKYSLNLIPMYNNPKFHLDPGSCEQVASQCTQQYIIRVPAVSVDKYQMLHFKT